MTSSYPHVPLYTHQEQERDHYAGLARWWMRRSRPAKSDTPRVGWIVEHEAVLNARMAAHWERLRQTQERENR